MSGQERVRSASMVADLTGGGGSADVTIEYVIAGADVGTVLPVRALAFGVAEPVDARVVGGEAVTLYAAGGAARSGEVVVLAGEKPGETTVRVAYRVPGAVDPGSGTLVGHVPVLTVDRPPEGAGPGLFRAELLVPEAWAVSEGFPTGLRGIGGAPGRYQASLAVVPSVVSFRAATGGRWRPGLPLLLDVAAVASSLAFAVAGWRFLGRST